VKRTNRQSETRGVALILVVFAIAFVSALVAVVLEVATTDLAILRNHTSGLKALYAAEAGVAEAIVALRNQYDAISTLEGTLTAPDGSICSYYTKIDNTEPVVTVSSIGRAAGFTRAVQARLVVAGPPMEAPYPVRVVWWREATVKDEGF